MIPPRIAMIGVGVLALLILLPIAKGCYDRSVEDRRDAEVTAKTLATDSAAKEQAGVERERDRKTIDQAEKDRNDAIHQAQDGQPSAASVRLNCQRLRHAGQDTSRIAACRGLGGGNQAGAD